MRKRFRGGLAGLPADTWSLIITEKWPCVHLHPKSVCAPMTRGGEMDSAWMSAPGECGIQDRPCSFLRSLISMPFLECDNRTQVERDTRISFCPHTTGAPRGQPTILWQRSVPKPEENPDTEPGYEMSVSQLAGEYGTDATLEADLRDFPEWFCRLAPCSFLTFAFAAWKGCHTLPLILRPHTTQPWSAASPGMPGAHPMSSRNRPRALSVSRRCSWFWGSELWSWKGHQYHHCSFQQWLSTEAQQVAQQVARIRGILPWGRWGHSDKLATSPWENVPAPSRFPHL